MPEREIKKGVYLVGVPHWDRRLFDELIPLPDGTSYNAYLIKGSEKIALIDTVDPAKERQLILNLESLGVKHIDYVVANHAEQDHSGAIPKILELFPDAMVVTNPKCKDFLKELLLINDNKFIEVQNGDTISLGDKTLEFIYTPWVHWPETMSTYLKEDKILFSCDFFGSHRATSSIFVEDEYKVIEDAKRYYAEIMMPFRPQIRKNIVEIEKREIDMIAPSHGPVYQKPSAIINAYKEWVSEDKVEKKIILPYISMHGSVEKMVEYFTDIFIGKGAKIIPMNLETADIGEFAMELVDAGALVFAAPYVLGGAHPQVVYSVYLANALRPKTKIVSFIFSYGWGGRGYDQLKGMLSNIKAEFIEPVLIKGYPKEEDFKKLDRLSERICDKIKHL